MTQPKRSNFDLTHDVKFSCNFGNLYPVYAQFCMPSDRIQVSQEALIRALPLVSPVMHRINVSMHTFFVPMRLLWENWEKWCTNTKVGSPIPALPAHPTMTFSDFVGNWTALADYLGIPDPTGSTMSETVSAMPFAAYQCIYNEYYRDQNLITEVPYQLQDGDNSSNLALTTMRKRAWKHDYFTSNLPFAQKGDAVNMPLNFPDVPVRLNDILWPPPEVGVNVAGTTQIGGLATTINIETDTAPGVFDDIFAQTSTLAGNTSINDLRTAEALQRWLERAARGGSRYTEWILSMYGTRSSDARLQRPEYINGSVTPLLITDTVSTAETASAPQGNLAGYGVSRVNGRRSGYFCEEFGIIMTVMSIMPETAYQQGIEKSLWLRYNDPSELPNPLFAHLGEQETKVREIFAYHADSNDLFGYLPRFAEDRFQNSRVAGQMRSTLDFWHLGRIFANPPALNQTFIECDPSYRIFAVTDPGEDHFVCHVLNQVDAYRPLPKYADPRLT